MPEHEDAVKSYKDRVLRFIFQIRVGCSKYYKHFLS
jgi:hypothetical protein